MHIALIDTLIPHYCCSCGEIGRVLCDYCKYDIINEPFGRCVTCMRPTARRTHLCGDCAQPYTQAWCVGERSGPLKDTINKYKFDSVRQAAAVLAELLDDVVPIFPHDICVVPVPTIATHARQRGFDHIVRLAKRFAHIRGYAYQAPLHRTDKSHQQGSSRSERIRQAKRAFSCDSLDSSVHYLLIDDVYTTGATLHYAAKAMRDAGACSVYVAVISRQPLEKCE